MREKTTGMHPPSRHWHLLGYFFVRRRDRRDVLVTMAIPVADDRAAAADVNTSVENRWCQLRNTVQSTALTVLAHAQRQHQDWFDDDAAISNLLAKNNRLHMAYVSRPTDDNEAAFYRRRRLAQRRLWEMQYAWTACKAEEIQGYADRNKWKNSFAAIRAAQGLTAEATAPILSGDSSTQLTEKTQILRRWAEHFRGLLSRSSTISDAAIARLPQEETTADLDLPPSLSTKSPESCSSSPGRKPPDRTRPLPRSASMVAQPMDHLTVLLQEM
ncbi:hypothetical protein SprV_0200788400 [Sparganum proliferum]